MVEYVVFKTKHNGRENSDFKLYRPKGTDDYLFIHFKSPVIFNLSGEVTNVTPGMCILLSPKTPHSFYPDNCTLVHDWMHFMPLCEEDFLNLKIDLNTFFTLNDLSFITTFVKRCEIELVHKDELYEELVSSQVKTMLITIRRRLSDNVPMNHYEEFRLLRTDMYRHPESYADTQAMADKVGLSRSRFSVIYKLLFKASPQNDHISARIAKAEHLLSLGTLSVTEIAEECGYGNVYHFIRQFKSVTGATPGAYRHNK